MQILTKMGTVGRGLITQAKDTLKGLQIQGLQSHIHPKWTLEREIRWMDLIETIMTQKITIFWTQLMNWKRMITVKLSWEEATKFSSSNEIKCINN